MFTELSADPGAPSTTAFGAQQGKKGIQKRFFVDLLFFVQVQTSQNLNNPNILNATTSLTTVFPLGRNNEGNYLTSLFALGGNGNRRRVCRRYLK